MKKKSVAVLLAVFLGIFGAHYFYTYNVKKGLLYLLLDVIGIGLLFVPFFLFVDIVTLIRLTDEEFIVYVEEQRELHENGKIMYGDPSITPGTIKNKYDDLIFMGAISTDEYNSVISEILR